MTGLLHSLSVGNRYELLGMVVGLMTQSHIHDWFTISDVQCLILPPLDLGQFRLYRSDKGIPVAFVSWAKVTEDTARKYLTGEYKNILPKDWNAGSEIILMDFMAPFGHLKYIKKDLEETVFPNDIGWGLRFKQIGKPQCIVPLHGKNVDKAVLKAKRKKWMSELRQ